VLTLQTAACHTDYARDFILKVRAIQVMYKFQQKSISVYCDGVVEYLMSTIQEQVKSFEKNTQSTRKLLRNHLTIPLYYVLTNGDATNLPLTWASIKRGKVHNNCFSCLKSSKNSSQKEELSDADLVDTGLVMQRRFYDPRGKREAIENTTTHNSASMSP
jgi:hypothetical protein